MNKQFTNFDLAYGFYFYHERYETMAVLITLIPGKLWEVIVTNRNLA